jgi:hypothetical protein
MPWMGTSQDPISRFLASMHKRRVVGRYLKILPRHLRHDYGHRGPYTPAQVEATIGRYAVSSRKYSAYAVAIFCDRDELQRLVSEGKGHPDYEALRTELSAYYFGGDSDFTFRDVARYAAQHGDHSHGDSHSGDGAAHHGGGSHH